MSVRLEGDVILLDGDCRVEDAEKLLSHLQANPARSVGLAGCGRMHGAVVQVLIAFRPPLIGEPADAFARSWIITGLSGQTPAPDSALSDDTGNVL